MLWYLSTRASDLASNNMRSARFSALIRSGLRLGLCQFLGACILSPLPDTRTPVDYAREAEARCKNFSDGAAAQLYAPEAVESVEPAYSYVANGNDRRPNLRGAAIHLRPLAGLSPELLTRSLECHQASVTLGRAPATADDPYILPGRWLDLRAASEGDGFVAFARIDSIADARVVLDRALRFVAARPAQ
jgi:hypothetical protein